MCGRYTVTMDPETIYGVFEAEPDGESFPQGSGPEGPGPERPGPERSGPYGGDAPRPRYNVAPTDTVPVVRVRPAPDALEGPAPDALEGPVADAPPGPREGRTGRRVVTGARWGLVPFWAKSPAAGRALFNARAESVSGKPAFRKAFASRRCLVPANGYYEWQAPPAGAPARARKQPFYITPADGSVLAFAGLWEFWRSPVGEPLVSTSIITTDSVGDLVNIHDRMPLILPASDWARWLDPAFDSADVSPLLAPPAIDLVGALELRPVGPAVGNVRNDDPSLIRRVDR